MIKSFFKSSAMTLEEAERFVSACYVGILNRFPEEAALKSCSQSLKNGSLLPLDFVESIIHSEEFKINKGSVDLKQFLSQESKFGFQSKQLQKKITRIVFFCFSSNRAVGGVKVIARYAELVGKMSNGEVIGELFFPESPNFEITWINFLASIKKDRYFDQNKDYVILPEMWAFKYGPLLIEHRINYSIFVQNGYLIFHDIQTGDLNSLKSLKEVYEKADLIMTISDDVDRCVIAAFPNIAPKIFRVAVPIKSDIFYVENKKKNLITYMPRKLPSHSDWLVSQLLLHLPLNWEILPIKGVSEVEVGKILRASKIFLSFSAQEGLGLPPLEAALSGNFVIGYTGESGKEYWGSPIFEEIYNGDLLSFLNAVLQKVNILSTQEGLFTPDREHLNVLSEIQNKFSLDHAEKSIQSLVAHVGQFY